MNTRTRVYQKAESVEQLPQYVCRKHGACEAAVTRRKSGYLHRRCRLCLREWQKANGARYQSNYREHCRRIVLEAYGGKCECCGETEERFLTIDHINNDGKEHRAWLRDREPSIYIWLAKNDCPRDGFRILCCNCNLGRAFNEGICPHVKYPAS